MNIKKTMQDATLNVVLEGELNTLTAPELEKALMGELAAIEAMHIDMSKLTYITSAGLRVLLVANQALDERGGITASGVSQEIREVFELTGFDSFLNIVE